MKEWRTRVPKYPEGKNRTRRMKEPRQVEVQTLNRPEFTQKLDNRTRNPIF